MGLRRELLASMDGEEEVEMSWKNGLGRKGLEVHEVKEIPSSRLPCGNERKWVDDKSIYVLITPNLSVLLCTSFPGVL